MIEAGLAALSFLKEFAPWIIAGVSALIAALYRGSAKRQKAARVQAEQEKLRAKAIADHSHQLANRLLQLDEEQQNERNEAIAKIGRNRDYFSR